MKFQPGNKIGNRFKPGTSGNPAGRPALAKTLRQEARDDAPMFYAALREKAADGDVGAIRLCFQIGGLLKEGGNDAPEQETPSAASTEELAQGLPTPSLN